MSFRITKRKHFVASAALGAALVVFGTSIAWADGAIDTADNAWPYSPQPKAPVLVTVGDISCQPDANSGLPGEAAKPNDTCSQTGTSDAQLRNQAQAATANEVESMNPTLVAILGDEQYQVGTLADFEGSFDKTYGAFKFLQRPSPGNHEFYTSHGQAGENGTGYFDYYNGDQLSPTTGQAITAADPLDPARIEPVPRASGQAGESGDGWYSYDMGGWHIISLNAECAVNSPGFNSCANPPSWYAQETQWLAQDLHGDHASCTLAYWHQPTWSATSAPLSSTVPGTGSPEGAAAQQWWKLLATHGADLVLNGHEHVYGRFAPMNANGQADPKHGIRQFIVGTGGESLDALYTDPSGDVAVPNLQAAEGSGTAYQNGGTSKGYAGAFGVMKLTLDKDGYAWDYESAPAPNNAAGNPAWASFSDAGSGRCHGPSESDE
ncbi:MAG TPA: metallophosphoesterase [Candidatus Acidoferrum sp.]|nr:metallophosphoesterase [Candidatus Acidoferrum sp.]